MKKGCYTFLDYFYSVLVMEVGPDASRFEKDRLWLARQIVRDSENSRLKFTIASDALDELAVAMHYAKRPILKSYKNRPCVVRWKRLWLTCIRCWVEYLRKEKLAKCY